MRILIIVVGKIKEKYLRDGIAEYLKRLAPYAKVEIRYLADEPTTLGDELIKAREAERILRAVPTTAYLIALDGSTGQQLSSEELSRFVSDRKVAGESNLAFVIGGSVGLATSVLERADSALSFGRLTFLHQMMPLLLLEQLYRAFKIEAGEPYHK